ncbi:MAG: hypothetical protein CBC35_11095 [Planctomycetes bacterium TMED75]|nr:hypothetical protein [Planctomycetaceae bacterium]OUU90794.1 MAG: hypothetical protein CBC35_11095 [Planctomycetes bacterium TMED75]
MATAVDWSQYLALRSLSAVVHCFDAEENMRTTGAFGSAYTLLSNKRRTRAQTNLQRSFPEIDSKEAARITKQSIRNMFQLITVDMLAMPKLLKRDNWHERVELGSLSNVIRLFIEDKPALFLTGHIGNWEVLGYLLSLLGFPMTALARPIDNPLINDWLLGLREAHGMKVITKFGATNEVDELVKNGGRVGFIADQNAGDKGLFVPFFGRMASSYKSIGLLAMRNEVPIVTGYARRIKDQFRYRLITPDIIYPEDWVDQPDPLFYITARFNRAMEQMVRINPEQYFWVHRRWKSRPKWERRGEPMPSKVIAKLETLPWMTPALLDQIIANSRLDAGLSQ